MVLIMHKLKKTQTKVIIISVFIGLIALAFFSYYLNKVTIFSSIVGSIFLSAIIFSILILMLTMLKSKILAPLTIIIGFMIFYYTSGIVNLSEYRGYIDEYLWTKLLVFSVLSFIGGHILYGFVRNKYRITSTYNEISIFKSSLVLLLAFIATIIITLQNGILLLNPGARSNVSAVLQYMVEFSIPVVILLFNAYSKSHRKATILLVLITTLLLFSLGYRNQPMILLLCIFLSIAISNRKKLNYFKINIKLSLIISILLVLFSLLYILRIEKSDDLYDFHKMTDYYNVHSPQITLLLLPFHLQSREAMGVTEIAIERNTQVNKYIDSSLLFIQDIITLLPGDQISAGNVLGIVVNLNPNVSLTPGLIGGLYISFSLAGLVIGLFLLGYLVHSMWRKYLITNSAYHLTIVTIMSAYIIELINRGFFKPMYIIVFIILRFCIRRITNEEK
jgi:oligosaccharide repeat unit polymerase